MKNDSYFKLLLFKLSVASTTNKGSSSTLSNEKSFSPSMISIKSATDSGNEGASDEISETDIMSWSIFLENSWCSSSLDDISSSEPPFSGGKSANILSFLVKYCLQF